MIALAYLACVAAAVVILAVALRHHPAPAAPPTPPAPVPAPALSVVPTDAGAEVRVILAAAHQLAARMPAAA